MRSEAVVGLVGAVVAVLLMAGRWALLPEAPTRPRVPRVESLEGLTAYLAADSARPLPDGGARIRLTRDPFGSASTGSGPGEGEEREARGPRWRVSAIMISEDRRIAIVDDRLVEQGASLPGGGRVVAIARDHVVVQGPDGVRHRIALNR